MKLVDVQVRTFKNFLDSSQVMIEPSITCVVGKNESGKSAFLHALYRSNPAHSSAKFSIQKQYPAWLEKLHRREGKDLDRSRPVTATFELEAADLAILEPRLGPGTLTSKRVILEREYKGTGFVTCQYDEGSAVRHVLRGIKIPADFEEQATRVSKLTDLDALSSALTAEGGESHKAASDAIVSAKAKLLGKSPSLVGAVVEAVEELTPRFFYFDEYSSLPGTVKIRSF